MNENLNENMRLKLRMSPAIHLTDDQFYHFCQINRGLRMERTGRGELLIMAPAGGETGHRNAEIIMSLGIWAKKDGTGIVFDSSTGFILPDGDTRSPDAAWVRRSKLAALTSEQKKKFIPLCPDFVVKLRSPSDSLDDLQGKMRKYMENGAELGWLIDPTDRKVYAYRSQNKNNPECFDNPSHISGVPTLPGFVLELEDIWEGF